MPRKFGQDQAWTILFIGVIAVLFVVQARVALHPDHRLTFDIGKMNVAYGYGSSSTSSSGPVSETGLCSNTFDDDNDGQLDCADTDCSGDMACVISSSSSSVGVEAGNCNNAFDDDNDGLIDCNDTADCSADMACVVSSSSSSSSSTLACGVDSGADQAVLYQGHCYLLYTGVDKTWANAKTACASYNSAYLASLTASAENTAMADFTFAGSTWIGLNDQSTEGTYVWDHGNPFSYSNWAGGQPDNSGNQDCASIQTNRTWNDDTCGSSTDYLCEYVVTSTCGDGEKELSEACDDGDNTNGDGCSASCTVESGWSCSGSLPTACAEVCGNGIVTSGEECDDGNTSDGDGCTATCTEQSGWGCTGSPSACETDCGDGIVAGSEACDDGNATDTDACRNSCVFASCGDGVVQPNGSDGISGNEDDETCDTSGESVSCDANCTAVACGDQTVNTSAGETCDDGNGSNTDGCLTSCVSASCGDGYVRSGVEGCEPPGVGTCTASCSEAVGIGNVYQEAESSSSFSRAAPPPNCGNGILEPALGEGCDEGRFNGLSPICDRWCNVSFCGDGVVHAGEEECEPVLQQNGTFGAQTCGGRTCTIPLCSSDGSCVGGCHWVFLPACMVTQKPVITLFPLSSDTGANGAASSVSNVTGASSSVVQILPVFTNASSSSPESPIWMPMMSLPTFSFSLPPSSSSVSSGPVTICGNGVREGSEMCDDGLRNSNTLPDSCRINCTLPICGDKVVDFGESCDDGNDIIGDGCTPLCTTSACGNGVLESGEECDDGLLNSPDKPDSCSDRCLLPRCGDGDMDAAFGEQCDQGQDNSNTIPDRCRLNCLRPHCGDGTLDDGEQCDDGNSSNLDNCSVSCKKMGCGNGVKDWNEQCDDGNTANGDGCSSSCLAEKQSFFQWLNKAIRLPFQW